MANCIVSKNWRQYRFCLYAMSLFYILQKTTYEDLHETTNIIYNHFQEYLHTTEVLKTVTLILLMEEN
jgi:hypothetical protein